MPRVFVNDHREQARSYSGFVYNLNITHKKTASLRFFCVCRIA